MFSKGNLYQNFQMIEKLPDVNNSLIRKLYSEFSLDYVKENNVNPMLFKSILKQANNSNLRNLNFFNKLIVDYSNNFEKLYNLDHLLIIKAFSSVNLNHKELILSATTQLLKKKNIEISDLTTLFNCLVNLGYTNQEWKDLVLNKIVNNPGFVSHITSNHHSSVETKVHSLLAFYSLQWPSNHKEIVKN